MLDLVGQDLGGPWAPSLLEGGGVWAPEHTNFYTQKQWEYLYEVDEAWA